MKVLSILSKYIKLVLTLIPTSLPQGMAEFNRWADSIISISNFPTEDTDSIKFVLSTLIMHLGPTAAFKPKMYFILAIKAGAAKQVASGVFQEIKMKQQAAAIAEQEKQKAEVTANTTTVTSNEILRNT